MGTYHKYYKMPCKASTREKKIRLMTTRVEEEDTRYAFDIPIEKENS